MSFLTAAVRVLLPLLLLSQATLGAPSEPVQATPAPDPTAQVNAMKRLSFLEGRWAGNAWIVTAPGKKSGLQHTEEATYKAGGTALSITGIGRRDGKTVHDALVILSYDVVAAKYRMHTWIETGRMREMDFFNVQDRGYHWGFQARGWKYRYTMTLTDTGEWLEFGERSQDGQTWTKFFETRLEKVE